MIQITHDLAIDEEELQEEFAHATGPGGQNVNKVASAVRLRFDAARSPSLPEEVRGRLLRLAGQRATADGVIVIHARRFRTQEQNRADARARLIELIRRAAVAPRPRRPTRPSQIAQLRRLEAKRRRSQLKRARQDRPEEE